MDIRMRRRTGTRLRRISAFACEPHVTAHFPHVKKNRSHAKNFPVLMMLFDSVCFWLSCLHVFCGPWHMCCVFFIHISFFWVMHVKTWCPGKFPGHPDPQIIHVCAPPLFILPISRVITYPYTHVHSSTPIYTLNMLIIVGCMWLNK